MFNHLRPKKGGKRSPFLPPSWVLGHFLDMGDLLGLGWLNRASREGYASKRGATF
jgi:hypothetical protein